MQLLNDGHVEVLGQPEPAEVLEGMFGTDRVDRNWEPTMGGEDFAFMANEKPGCFVFIGNGDSAMVHTPRYDFNDEIIPAGCSWWAGIVEQRMPA